FEAGLDRVVKLDKPGDFVGREILEKISAAAAESGPRKILAGLAVRGRGIARQGHPIYLPGGADFVGVVTSGTASPTLGHPIAMAYLPPDASRPGTMVEVGIRASRIPAEVGPLPFYQRHGAG
ncbi:MAG: glycine cleavage T C-terminal barrel domain-containing protein, partial [Candidatus Limnocylindrales bacterium]